MAEREYETGFEVTDEQWAVVAPLLPTLTPSPNGGPKPVPNRPCFEGIVWVLRSGARWKDMPKHFPSASTCWRRLQFWEDEGVLLDAWRALLGTLDAEGQIRWHECFADGTFSPAKKGARASERPNAERVRSLWWWRMARVCLWEYNLPRQARTKSR
jgi:transposase